MLKQLLLIGAAVFLAAINAQARIGYTLAECVKAYGPVIKEQPYLTGDLYNFKVGEYDITVWMFEGKVASISYAVGLFSNNRFTASDFKEIRDRNAGSRVWEEDETDKTYHLDKSPGLPGLIATYRCGFSWLITVCDEELRDRARIESDRLEKQKQVAAKEVAFGNL